MELHELPEPVQAELQRIGASEVVVGIVTGGPAAGLTAIAAAIRSALDTRLAGQSAVVIHMDRPPFEEAAAQLAEGLGSLPCVHVPHSAALDGDEGAIEWSDAVHTVLHVGRAAKARTILMLGAETAGSAPEWPASLAEPVERDGCGLVVGVYQRNRYDGTLTQSLVIPFVWGLFGRQFRQPAADEFACSAEAAQFFLEQDVWATDLGRHGLPFWLPIAALERDLPLGLVPLGRRAGAVAARPMPLGPTVGRVAGALFGLAERFEPLWLDSHGSEAVPLFGELPEPLPGGAMVDPERMHVGFRQGVRDLLPIWERILAPETLGDVLALSEGGPGATGIPDRLWAHVVYDFLLAFRARVMYRAHLVQSLAPLYLGRAAALVAETRARPPAAVLEVTERLGRIFEEERPYLVDRWR